MKHAKKILVTLLALTLASSPLCATRTSGRTPARRQATISTQQKSRRPGDLAITQREQKQTRTAKKVQKVATSSRTSTVVRGRTQEQKRSAATRSPAQHQTKTTNRKTINRNSRIQ